MEKQAVSSALCLFVREKWVLIIAASEKLTHHTAPSNTTRRRVTSWQTAGSSERLRSYEGRRLQTCVCVCSWSPVRYLLSPAWCVTQSHSIVKEGDRRVIGHKYRIHLITAACMLVAMETINKGLNAPEACVISAASFEVRGAQSQKSQVTLSLTGCVPSRHTKGHTVTDSAVKHTHTVVNTDMCQHVTQSNSIIN